MSISELYALWIGFRLGEDVMCVNTGDKLGEEHLSAMRRGERMPVPGTNFNIQRISCDHEIIGYGHIVEQVPIHESLVFHTPDLEDMRAAIKAELEAKGIVAPIVICAERITPLDGSAVH